MDEHFGDSFGLFTRPARRTRHWRDLEWKPTGVLATKQWARSQRSVRRITPRLLATD